MSTQLTISIELITFMQWILTNKSDAFAAFITETVDADLRDTLIRLSHEKSTTLSSDKLYETLSNFVEYIEHHLQATVHDEAAPLIPTRKAKKKARRSATHHHAPNCTMRGADMNEIQSIQSPTQRVLYQALFSNENSSENGVN